MWLDEYEPCDRCDEGLCYFVALDGRRLCRNCVHEVAGGEGLDGPRPERPTSPSPEPAAPPIEAETKASRKEQKEAFNTPLFVPSPE